MLIGLCGPNLTKLDNAISNSCTDLSCHLLWDGRECLVNVCSSFPSPSWLLLLYELFLWCPRTLGSKALVNGQKNPSSHYSRTLRKQQNISFKRSVKDTTVWTGRSDVHTQEQLTHRQPQPWTWATTSGIDKASTTRFKEELCSPTPRLNLI